MNDFKKWVRLDSVNALKVLESLAARGASLALFRSRSHARFASGASSSIKISR